MTTSPATSHCRQFGPQVAWLRWVNWSVSVVSGQCIDFFVRSMDTPITATREERGTWCRRLRRAA